MINLLEQVQQCGDQLFDFQDSIVLDELFAVGITLKRTENEATSYIIYFEGSLFQLNKKLGLPSIDFLRDGGQYFFPPDDIMRNMGFCDAGIIEVDELDSSVKVSFEDSSHAIAFVERYIKGL